MGVDLSLWVVDDTQQPWRVTAEHKLSRHYGDQDRIAACGPEAVPKAVMPSRLESGEDGYGDVTFVRAGTLPEYLANDHNLGIVLLLRRRLRPDQPVILFWS